MVEFCAIGFVDALTDAVAASERAGEQFAADPSILGPLLCSTSRELRLLTLRYEALRNASWQVRKDDDSKWRVFSASVSSELLDGQEEGFDSAEEALDGAILRCAIGTGTE